MGPAESQMTAKKNIVEAVKQTAQRLGNRPATCRKYYIHPAILDAYVDGTLFGAMRNAPPQEGPHGLSREEVAMMQLLAAHKPEPLKTVEQDKDLSGALKKSVAQAGTIVEVEAAPPATAVA
jgi:DNA topoisomerase-1